MIKKKSEKSETNNNKVIDMIEKLKDTATRGPSLNMLNTKEKTRNGVLNYLKKFFKISTCIDLVEIDEHKIEINEFKLKVKILFTTISFKIFKTISFSNNY